MSFLLTPLAMSIYIAGLWLANEAIGEPMQDVLLIGATALGVGVLCGRIKTYQNFQLTGDLRLVRYKSWDGFLLGYSCVVLLAGVLYPSNSGVVLLLTATLSLVYAFGKMTCQYNGCCRAQGKLGAYLPTLEAVLSAAVYSVVVILLFQGATVSLALVLSASGHLFIRGVSKLTRT